MDILLRKDAVKLGLKRYFNGVPCPRGHVAERLVMQLLTGSANRTKSTHFEGA